METTSFSLVKWYMDCVTDAGETIILYCADLRWRGIHATLGNLLAKTSDGSPLSRTSLARYELTPSADQIAVRHPRLKVEGAWHAAAPPFSSTVYECAEGSVVWNCIQPRSQVSVCIADRDLRGLGYAECLTITVLPWHLPLRELRWGRFVSPDHTLAWVDWRGSFATSLAFFDSRRCSLRSTSESQVDIGDAALEIAPGPSLRSGRLGATVARGVSGLRRLFPNSLLNVDEQKSLGSGTMTIDGRASTGWVIHEVVKWEL